MINGRLHIVASCTLGKTSPPVHRLGSFVGPPWETVAEQWHARTMAEPGPIRAGSLYKGLHWQLVLRCATTPQSAGIETDLWIASAGHALMHAEDRVTSYSATFAKKGPDSIHRLDWPEQCAAKERSRRWWDALCGFAEQRRKPGLRSLGQRDPGLVIFIVPRDYYRAIEHEILALHTEGVPLLVACGGLSRGGTAIHPGLQEAILPLSDRSKQLHPSLDVPNTSLNAAFCSWLLTERLDLLSIPLPEVIGRIRAEYEGLPRIEKPAPRTITDQFVRDYIARHYDAGTSSATAMLRRLRRDGFSCEQFRFSRLYKDFERAHLGLGDLFDAT